MVRTGFAFLLAVTMAFAQDLAGTYTGTLRVQTPDGQQDAPGTIVIKQEKDNLTITAGPQPDQQLPATKVERDGTKVKFEIHPPGGDVPRVMRFDITVAEGKLTGEATMTRGDEVHRGQLNLVKQ